MRFFRSAAQPVVGIDIGTHSIKLVELAGSASRPKVVAWGVAHVPQGAFAENAIADSDAIAETLNGLLLKSGASSDQVAVSVSSSHAITKVLSMPDELKGVGLEEQIGVEALHFIPYPIDEVNIDFEVLGPSTTNKEENDVLLVACRRSIVDDYIDLIEGSNLSLRYVDIDTYALERIYRSQNSFTSRSAPPVAVFDIGSSSSHLLVLDHERVLYSRHQNFGAAQLIKLIRKEYGVNATEAEETLMSAQPPSDFKQSVQEPFVELLKQEVNRALQFFYSSSSFTEVANISLSGACCSLNGLASDLEQKMRTEVKVLNPLSNAIVKSNKRMIDSVAPGLSIAYGLSLRGLK